jgi:hypothetical protein
MAKFRFLSNAEIAVAKPVFQDSLPWHDIRVTDSLGADGRPWARLRYLNVGQTHYRLGMDKSRTARALLVHELTHIWQNEHDGLPAYYMLESLIAQIEHGKKAYQYKPGRNWDDYNPEQQAEIVKDWFDRDAQSVTSNLFPYIRDHIRAKKMSAHRVEYPETF